MRKALLLFCALLVGCAGADDSLPADEPNEFNAPFAQVVRECDAHSRAAGATPEVHTVGYYLARGETLLNVRVSIPEAPRLARCIEQGVSRDAAPATGRAGDALASGSFAIDLGGAPPPVGIDDIERRFAEHERVTRELLEEVVARGVLRADDAAVHALLDELPAR